MTLPPLLDIVTLATGTGKCFSLYSGIRLTIIPTSGATVTYSKVDSDKATAHDTPTTLTTTEEVTIDADWPFYYISTAAEAARVAVV